MAKDFGGALDAHYDQAYENFYKLNDTKRKFQTLPYDPVYDDDFEGGYRDE